MATFRESEIPCDRAVCTDAEHRRCHDMGSMVGATICVYCGRSDGECDRVEVQIPEHHGRGICTITLCGRCDTSTGFTETLDGLTIRHRCGWHHVPGSRCLCKPDIERCDVPPSEPAQGQDAPNSSRGSAVEPRTGAEGTSVTPQPSAGLYGENGPEVLTEAERALCADGARLSGAATPGPWEPLFKGVTLSPAPQRLVVIAIADVPAPAVLQRRLVEAEWRTSRDGPQDARGEG